MFTEVHIHMVEICHDMSWPTKILAVILIFVDLAPRLDNSSPTVWNAGILIADTQLGKNYPKFRVFQSDTPRTILERGSVPRRQGWRGGWVVINSGKGWRSQA